LSYLGLFVVVLDFQQKCYTVVSRRCCLDRLQLSHFPCTQDFYEPIDKAGLVGFLKNFLSSEDSDIRAKACSAIGNMCRHSSNFYGSLVRKFYLISCKCRLNCMTEILTIIFLYQAANKVIQLVVERCSDPDKRTRKFACFAVSL
jgi:fused